MKLHVHVKFRALGITWSELDRTVLLPSSVQTALMIGNVKPAVLFSDKGVLVELI